MACDFPNDCHEYNAETCSDACTEARTIAMARQWGKTSLVADAALAPHESTFQRAARRAYERGDNVRGDYWQRREMAARGFVDKLPVKMLHPSPHASRRQRRFLEAQKRKANKPSTSDVEKLAEGRGG